jgi:hypothetical protein
MESLVLPKKAPTHQPIFMPGDEAPFMTTPVQKVFNAWQY